MKPQVSSLPAHASSADIASLADLTGHPSAAALSLPFPIGGVLDDVLDALRGLSAPFARRCGLLSGEGLLIERARINGLVRKGLSSAGGACRLIRSREDWLAVNLPRASDWGLLPAWLGDQVERGDWTRLASLLAEANSEDLLERARLLGLAVARSPDTADCRSPEIDPGCIDRALEVIRQQPMRRPRRAPRVLDLSSLWAGPLCASLLRECGADVVKLESTVRPDGARNGAPEFFDLMNGGKRCVALDFSQESDRRKLRDLIMRADIVIEASRPRALRQLGIDAAQVVKSSGGTWISITGYGRAARLENHIAYGDDAGVAAGLSALVQAHHRLPQPVFVGDAIADPLTGVHAAYLAWLSWCHGGGHLIDLPLASTVRVCMDTGRRLPKQRSAVCAPRRAIAAARPLGADNDAVFADWDIRC